MTIKQETAGWVRHLTTQKGLTFKELAEQSGVNYSTITRWVNGRQFPRPDRFKKIVSVLLSDITTDALYHEATLGGKLFLLRNSEGLTVSELAYSLVYSANSIRIWESDTRIPNENQLRRILNFFGIEPHTLGIDVQVDTFGSRMQTERKLLEITQMELAEHIQSDPVTISYYENDKKIPTDKELVALSRALNVSIEALILEEDGLPFEAFAALYVKELRKSKKKVTAHTSEWASSPF